MSHSEKTPGILLNTPFISPHPLEGMWIIGYVGQYRVLSGYIGFRVWALILFSLRNWATPFREPAHED